MSTFYDSYDEIEKAIIPFIMEKRKDCKLVESALIFFKREIESIYTEFCVFKITQPVSKEKVLKRVEDLEAHIYFGEKNNSQNFSAILDLLYVIHFIKKSKYKITIYSCRG